MASFLSDEENIIIKKDYFSQLYIYIYIYIEDVRFLLYYQTQFIMNCYNKIIILLLVEKKALNDIVIFLYRFIGY
jgi:hypothetical protein